MKRSHSRPTPSNPASPPLPFPIPIFSAPFTSIQSAARARLGDSGKEIGALRSKQAAAESVLVAASYYCPGLFMTHAGLRSLSLPLCLFRSGSLFAVKQGDASVNCARCGDKLVSEWMRPKYETTTTKTGSIPLTAMPMLLLLARSRREKDIACVRARARASNYVQPSVA